MAPGAIDDFQEQLDHHLSHANRSQNRFWIVVKFQQAVLPKNSIRRLYQPKDHTSNWVTARENGRRRIMASAANRAVSPLHPDG